MTKRYQPWGRFPKADHQVLEINSRFDPIPLPAVGSVLPFGLGRSYGDSCVNNGNTIISCQKLNRFIDFDPSTGILSAEAGVSLQDIVETFVPKGWFLPVSPGTKFVTLGGAIANDIHGKNHHRSGTFGRHVRRFGLVRSNGERLVCSPTDSPDLFNATIGGLGLTGLITWAEIELKPVKSGFLDTSTIKFRNLQEFFDVSAEYEPKYEYTVSWVDCTSKGNNLGRGLFMAGNFSEREKHYLPQPPKGLNLTFPIDAPSFALNPFSVKAFNELYYQKQRSRIVEKLSYYDSFFYPLDAILHWNRLYGNRGFFQYQLVVPYDDKKIIESIFKLITDFGKASFLAVLKTFGDLASPGMMSFPKPGVTLALDFPNDGPSTFHLMEKLDEVVRNAGGCVYPAKDARMSPESFKKYFPMWQEFSEYVDPRFSSSFWRRVTAGESI